jgi:hypothetical protein
VSNGSGADLDRFAVLGLDGALIDPSTGPDEFAERPGFSGVAPTSDHVGNGKFAILLEPAASDEVAMACIAGACVCKLNITSADDAFADADSGTTAALVTGPSGPVQILWKESGTGSDKWGIVRFGAASGPLMVFVTIDGSGVAGDPTTTCTLTYTVHDRVGNLLGTEMTPETPDRYANCEYRQVADNSPALGYFDPDGTFRLITVFNEIPVGDVVTMQEQRLNGLDIETRTRDILVLEAADYSDWAVLDEGTECP